MWDEDDYNSPEDEANLYPDIPDEEDIARWDYRLIRGEDGLLTIGEVYYNSKEEPIGWMLEAAVPESTNVEEIISELKKMLDATQKPLFQPPKGEIV